MVKYGIAAACLAGLLSGAAAAQTGFGETRDLPDLPDLPRDLDASGGLRAPDQPVPALKAPGAPVMRLAGVRFEGNTVFSSEELTDQIRDLIGKTVSLEELESARLRLTRHYIDAGYVSSGVLLQPQTVDDGVVVFTVVEGTLTAVNVFGEDIGDEAGFGGQLTPDYVADRLALPPGAPLNMAALQERFELLLADPAITRLRGDLRPGAARGEAELEVEAAIRDPLTAAASFNNHHPVSTGAYGGDLDVSLFNLTGHGDFTTLRLEGTENRISGFGRFELPVDPRGITPFVEAEYADSGVTEKPFDSLDIDNRFWRLSAGVRVPVLRDKENEVALTASFDLKRSRTTLLDFPFPPPGVDADEVKASIIRFSQEWVNRRPDQVLALRSTFSLGVDVFDATGADPGFADGTFFAWLGQAQYVRRIDERVRIKARAQAQFASGPLFSFEQVGLGGVDSVRGYRENAVVEDNAFIASLEAPVHVFDLAVPEFTPPGFDGPVELTPFFDIGVGWPEKASGSTTLIGAGLGLRWLPRPNVALELIYGRPLKDLDRGAAEDDLTDEAVYFNVTIATN